MHMNFSFDGILVLNIIFRAFDATASDIKNKTYAMLMNLNDWTAFSNHTAQPDTTEVATSIEGIHDMIHGIVGGNGHMGNTAIACE
jgi:hypothetical protein